MVYWEKIDKDWLEAIPLKEIDTERRAFAKMGPEDVYLESYYFGPLKADFGHISLALWDDMVAAIMDRLEPEQETLKSIDGFINAIPLYGDSFFLELQERVATYPEELVPKVIKGSAWA